MVVMITTPVAAPVVDAGALGQLGEQLGDADMLSNFVRRYVSMLEQRIERLHVSLSACDPEDWQDAVLSLKTSSAMVGAVALSRLAGDLEQQIMARHAAGQEWPGDTCVARVMARLQVLAQETARQLSSLLNPES